MRSVIDTGDPEIIVRTFMDGMPPEWFDAVRNGPAWPSYATMAPSLLADVEALVWAETSPRRARWTGVAEGSTVLVGSGAFDFIAEAAAATAASLPSTGVSVLPGVMHRWEPRDLADAIAAALSAGPGTR